MKIIKDFNNELLGRREVKAVLQNSGNPGFEHCSKLIENHFKVPAELIVMNNVKGKFGRGTFLVDCFLYSSLDKKKSFEQKPKVKKDSAGGK